MKKSNILPFFFFLVFSLVSHAQSTVLVKVFDESISPMPGLELSLDDGDHHITSDDGSYYLNLDEQYMPPKSINVKDRSLEAESWNYSKGILEVIVRKKSYRMVTVYLRDGSGNGLSGLRLTLLVSEPIQRQSAIDGSIKIPIPLNIDIMTTHLLKVDGYVIKDRITKNGEAHLVLERVVTVQAEKLNKLKSPTLLISLDTIRSLTVFYGFLKNLDLQRLDRRLRDQIDAKFYELVNQQNDSLAYWALQNPISRISDSSLVHDDINLLIEQVLRDEQNPEKVQAQFDQKIALINNKLIDDGVKLDEESREKLIADINVLDRILTYNDGYFANRSSDYHDILTEMKNKLLSMRYLEERLNDVQNQRLKEQQAFRSRLFKFSLILLGLAILSFVLLLLLKKINKQKRALDVAHRELNKINENLEDLVHQRTKLLKQTNKELDTFLYRSSHDLRRPITSMLGLVQLAKMTLGKKAMELFKRVELTARSMDNMLQKLIMVSHINQSSDFTNVDIKALSHKFNKEFQKLTDEHQVQLIWDLQKGISIQTCSLTFEIIIRNLVENALVFSGCRQALTKPRVMVSIFRREQELFLEVQDQGGGIDPGIQSKIWNMFFVGNEKSIGNGLGLYITRKAVDKLGADISFIENNEGTIFTVKIPTEKPVAPEGVKYQRV